MCMFEKGLPGGQRRKRQCRGLLVRDAVWLQSEIGRPHCRELGCRPVTWKISQAIYFVARPKIRDVRRHPFYNARDLMPRNARNPRRAVGVLITFIPGQFGGRNACGAYSYQHIPAPDLRQWCILEKQLLRPAPAVNSDRLHRTPPPSISPADFAECEVPPAPLIRVVACSAVAIAVT